MVTPSGLSEGHSLENAGVEFKILHMVSHEPLCSVREAMERSERFPLVDVGETQRVENTRNQQSIGVLDRPLRRRGRRIDSRDLTSGLSFLPDVVD